MTTSNFKEFAEGVESLLKSVGILVGALWVYRKFITTRENHAKIQFDIDLKILGRQDNKLLIEIIATFENKGLVRHWINNLTCDILILKESDPVVHGDERINYQVLFEKHNPKNNNAKQRIIWIPPNWYSSFVDPGVKQQYSYLSDVPDSTTFLSIYAQFYFNDKVSAFQTAQRSFSVKQLESDTIS